jgi:hypothetical protein
MKIAVGPRLRVGLVLSILGANANAAYLNGSAAVIDLGSGTSLSNGILTLEPSVSNTLAQSNPSSGSSFAAITSPSSELGPSYPLIGFNSTLNLNGVATVNGPTGSQTAEPIANLFDVGHYQFNLISLGVTAGGAVYGTGAWVDTTNALSTTGGLFTLSTSNGWSTYGGTYAATGAAPVPLPASSWLLLSSICGFGLVARKRRTGHLLVTTPVLRRDFG